MWCGRKGRFLVDVNGHVEAHVEAYDAGVKAATIAVSSEWPMQCSDDGKSLVYVDTRMGPAQLTIGLIFWQVLVDIAHKVDPVRWSTSQKRIDTSGKSLASVHHRKKFQPAPENGRGLFNWRRANADPAAVQAPGKLVPASRTGSDASAPLCAPRH
jgi:hypothetical protein